jgi:hypothetical protein
MNLSTFTKITLCLTLLLSLASCGSEKNDEKKPQAIEQVTQADQPKAQDTQPKAQAEKVKAQNDDKKGLPPAMVGIGLTAEQEGKIKAVVLESKKQFKAVREDATLDSAAKEEKLRSIGKAMFDQYKAILSPEQWKNFLTARKALMEKNKPVTPTGKES